MRRLRLLPLHLLVALGLLLAACGDDDDGDVAADEPSGENDSSSGAAGDDDAESAAEDAIAGELGECGFLAEFAGGLDDLALENAFASGEPVDFGLLFGRIAEEFGEVADAAPGEIEGAFSTLADAFDRVVAELDGVVVDFTDPESVDPEVLAKLDSLEASFGPEFEAAADEVDVWLQDNCADLANEIDIGGLAG